VRGAVVGWYPYEFFNPETASGWLGVIRFAVVILVLLVATTFGLVRSTQMSKSRTRHLARSPG
jgi:hypothetical protein